MPPAAASFRLPAASCQLLSGSVTHNGDDAWVLRRADNTVVDSFGQVGVDPGSAWGTGSTATIDRTLRLLDGHARLVGPGAKHQHADGDRPADGQQLAQVLVQ